MTAGGSYLALVNLGARPIGPLSPFSAHLFALSISLGISYFGHHGFTFRRSGRHGRFLTRFGVTTMVIFLAVSIMAWVGDKVLQLPAIVISSFVVVVYAALSLVLHSLWTFVHSE